MAMARRINFISSKERTIARTSTLRSSVLFTLQSPLRHGAEKLTGAIGMGLDFAPFGMIAEVEGAEVIDRFADAIAGADDENACGFGVPTGIWLEGYVVP
jgi:hypothetical protein